MPVRKANYMWRKGADAAWLVENEPRLAELSNRTHAVIEQAGRKRLLVEVFCRGAKDARELRTRFGGSVEVLEPSWLRASVQSASHAPLRIGKRLTIFSSADRRAAGDRLIVPAGAAFGTGEHVTTAMSLRFLEQCSRRLSSAWRLLDAGTGSGILALAAMRFGARRVIAIDNDPLAIKTARQNAAENGIRGVKFVLADVSNARTAGKFDLITANLFSELLTKVLPRWKPMLKTDGQLIASGILRSQEREVMCALRRHEFRTLTIRRRGKWIAILARVSPQKLG
jgi:ribosomal protein L11 methyltransferase